MRECINCPLGPKKLAVAGNTEGGFGLSAVLSTSGTQTHYKKIISYLAGATRLPYYISISFEHLPRLTT